MRNIVTFIILSFAAVTSSYAADQLIFQYNLNDTEAPIVPVKGVCPVTILSVNDMRPNKESIGITFKPIATSDGVPWMNAALGSLKAWGVDAKSASQPAAGGVGIRADLTRSYVWHGPLRLNGMVAMIVHYTSPSGKEVTRKYRASSSKTNWAGAVSEYGTTLNMAMNNVLTKIAADLPSICAEGAARTAAN